MPTSCCVKGCTNTSDTGKAEGRLLRFYNFSSLEWKKELMEKWVAFVGRKNEDGTPWKPKPWTRICSDHFVGGKKSEHPASPSYVPTIRPIPKSLSDNMKRRIAKLGAGNNSDEALPMAFETADSESVSNEVTATAAPACLICMAKMIPPIALNPNRDDDACRTTEDDSKQLLALLCDCAAIDLSNLVVTSENTFAFCETCSAYLKEWSVAQQEISKLILRSSQVKATLLSRLLESDSSTGGVIKKNREQKTELGSQIRALISKHFSVKVRLCDLRQGKVLGSSKHSESESPTDDEETQESTMASDEPNAKGPTEKDIQFDLKQEQDSDMDERLTSEESTTGNCESVRYVASANSSSYGTRSQRRIARKLSPSTVTPKEPEAELRISDNKPALRCGTGPKIRNKESALGSTKHSNSAVYTAKSGKVLKRRKKYKPRGVIKASPGNSSTYKGFRYTKRGGMYVCWKCQKSCGSRITMFREHVEWEHLGNNPQCLPKGFFRTNVTYVSGNKYLYRGKLPFRFRERDDRYQCMICLQEFCGDPFSQRNKLVEHFETKHLNSLLDPLYSAGPLYHPELRTSTGNKPQKRVDPSLTPAPTNSDSSTGCLSAHDVVQVKLECPEETSMIQQVTSQSTHFNLTRTTDVDPLATSSPPTATSSAVPVPTQGRRFMIVIRRKRAPYRLAIVRPSVPVPMPTSALQEVPVLQESSQPLTDLARPEAIPNLDPLDTSGWVPSASPLSAQVFQEGSAEADAILPDVSEIKTESPTEPDCL